jgi:hypothetical protein
VAREHHLEQSLHVPCQRPVAGPSSPPPVVRLLSSNRVVGVVVVRDGRAVEERVVQSQVPDVPVVLQRFNSRSNIQGVVLHEPVDSVGAPCRPAGRPRRPTRRPIPRGDTPRGRERLRAAALWSTPRMPTTCFRFNNTDASSSRRCVLLQGDKYVRCCHEVVMLSCWLPFPHQGQPFHFPSSQGAPKSLVTGGSNVEPSSPSAPRSSREVPDELVEQGRCGSCPLPVRDRLVDDSYRAEDRAKGEHGRQRL